MLLQEIVLNVLRYAAVAAGVFALVHAIATRGDAFTAAEKLTKPVWVGILAAATVVCLAFTIVYFLSIFGVVAIGVYLADVRPRLIEVQGNSGGGSRW